MDKPLSNIVGDLATLSLHDKPLTLKKEIPKELPESEKDQAIKSLVNFNDFDNKKKQADKQFKKDAPIYIEQKPQEQKSA